LITHLRFMAQQDDRTSMHSRNLAIVWAPNLLRSREIEAGLAAFTEARVQSVVTEFLIVNGDLLFSEKLQTIQYDAGITCTFYIFSVIIISFYQHTNKI